MEDRVRFSYVPFEGDGTGSPLGSWTFPKDTRLQPGGSEHLPTQYTNSLPTYANIPTTTMAAYIQDDWRLAHGLTLNLGVRYDLQLGSFNEDIPELLGKIEDKLGRDGSFPVDPSVVAQPKRDARRPQQLRPARRHRVGSGQQWRHEHPRRIRAVLRQHADAAELRRADLAAGASRSSSHSPAFPDPSGGQVARIVPLDRRRRTSPSCRTRRSIRTRTVQRRRVNRIIDAEIAAYADCHVREPLLGSRHGRNQPADSGHDQAKLYPQFVRVSFWQPTADNTYKALLLKVEKRMTHHYQSLVSYTLAKARTTTSSTARRTSYGYYKVQRSGTADRRHRLVASGIRRPAGRHAGVGRSAISDRACRSARRARCDLNNDGYTGDLPAGVLPGSGCRSTEPGRRSTRSGQRAALTPVTQVDCPGFANVDMRFSKFFRMRRHARRVHRAAVQHLRSRELRDAEQQHRRRQRRQRPPAVRTEHVAARQHQRAVAAGGVRRALCSSNAVDRFELRRRRVVRRLARSATMRS